MIRYTKDNIAARYIIFGYTVVMYTKTGICLAPAVKYPNRCYCQY